MKTKTRRGGPRAGGAAVETALVAPIALMLIVGTLVLGLGVFRYQQLESLAREGARWAAVHGPDYQSENGEPPPTSAQMLDEVILPRLVGLDPSELTCTLEMAGGTATVVLRYRWVPEAYLGAIELERRASAPITY